MKHSAHFTAMRKHPYKTGAILLILSAVIIMFQIWRTIEMYHTAVDMSTTLPKLKSDITILTVNIESERLYGESGKAALEEQAAAFVLPAQYEAERTTRTFQKVLDAAGSLSTVNLSIQSPETSDRTTRRPFTWTLTGPSNAAGSLLGIMQWSGYLTLHDTVGDATEKVLSAVQTDAPLSLPAVEELLRLDVLTYASRPEQSEDTALKDLPQELQGEVKQTLFEAGLADLRSTLRDVATKLRSDRTFPLPLIEIDDIRYENGRIQIGGALIEKGF